MRLTRTHILMIAALLMLNVCTAMAVVYSKHKSRVYHIELSELREEADELDVQWGRLQLEEGALSEYGRIERIATEKLGMKRPPDAEIRLVLE
ncbi:cell division protein FtsL [Granulosicoccaceae sp. 1_MG-2023]|nr:cell division protein FtsL [Granulosicoccaceae sp. 1_MG-2023]